MAANNYIVQYLEEVHLRQRIDVASCVRHSPLEPNSSGTLVNIKELQAFNF